MTREEYARRIDLAAELYHPDWNSPEWQEAIAKARENIFKKAIADGSLDRFIRKDRE